MRAFRCLGRIGWFAAVVNGISMVCYLSALRHTSVANVVVIYATAPFVAAGLAFRSTAIGRPGERSLTGVVALMGVAITVGGTPAATGSPRRPTRGRDDARRRDLHDRRAAPSRPLDEPPWRRRLRGSAS